MSLLLHIIENILQMGFIFLQVEVDKSRDGQIHFSGNWHFRHFATLNKLDKNMDMLQINYVIYTGLNTKKFLT